MAGGLAYVWKEWGIQILVLFSFTLQVFLLSFAGIRRRGVSAPWRILLWLAYQLADSTAIYTLGHLAVASRDAREQYLYAFWASFLLVHLGGPGNITAYSLEDNRLWRRHLLTLVVQVLGAAYVLYKYITAARPMILLAAILVFVVGVLKYGERTWALRCSNMSTIQSNIMKREKYPGKLLCCCLSENTGEPITNEEQSWSCFGWSRELGLPSDRVVIGDEELLQGAQSMFDVCQCRFVDAHVAFDGSEHDASCHCEASRKEDVLGVIEMELSLMYDILYTKAAVIHTWYGYCILVISPLATASALVLFHSSNKNGDGKVNVAFSYALLSCTLALETISVVRAMGSTWACALTYGGKWKPLRGAVTFIRRRFKAGSKRRWSGKIGQYNLLHWFTRDRTKLGSRLAARLGHQSWWNKVHYSDTIEISQDLKDRILRLRNNTVYDRDSRCVRALEKMGRLNAGCFTRWTLSEADFDYSVFAWHMATDTYLFATKEKHEENLVASVRVLSNYMMFLLMVQPEMLPGPIRNGQLHDEKLDKELRGIKQNQGGPFIVSPKKSNMLDKLFKKHEKLFQRDDPNDPSRIQQRKEVAMKFLDKSGSDSDIDDHDFHDLLNFVSKRTILNGYYGGGLLATDLLSMDLKTRDETASVLELIFEVWFEMLCYAAHHCSRDSHARQLNNGGEFITIIWILTHYKADEVEEAQEIKNKKFKKYQEDDQGHEAPVRQHSIYMW